MKKIISMVLCVLMIATMFTATAGQVFAAGNVTNFLSVTTDGVSDNKITYKISLKPNITKLTGAIIEVHFDGEDFKFADFSAKTGSSGVFVNGYKHNENGVYSIGYMDATGLTTGTSAKDFATITFDLDSDEGTMETFEFKCVEFITDDATDNDIKRTDSVQSIASFTFLALSMPKVTEVNSYGEGLRVVWEQAGGATGYNLYRKAANASSWTLLAEGITETEYIDNTISQGVEYYYTVSAVNNYGETTYDNAGRVGLNFGKIESISAVKTATGADISWSALEGAEKYEVYRALTSSNEWQMIKTVTDCKYSDNDIESGQEYKYKVKAIKSIYSADMACDPAVVMFIEAPGATILNTHEGIEIAFDEVGGAEKYIIEKKVADGEYTELVQILSSEGVDYYVDEDVTAGVSYSYKIRAVANDGTESITNNIGSVTRLGAPAGIEIRNTASGISLKWGAVEGATSYVVYRKTSGTSFTKLKEVTTTSYVDKSYISGVEYTYIVRANNTTGESADSNPPVSYSFIGTPVIKSVSAIRNTIKIVWDKVDGAEGYKVYRSEEGGSWKNIGTVNTTEFVDENCEGGVYYKYTVKAFAGSFESYYNTAGVSGMCFGNVTSINAKTVTSGAEITWGALDGVDSYDVYRKTEKEADFKKLATVDAPTTKYTDTNMPGGITCYYMVRACKDGNYSEMLCDYASAKYLKAPKATAKNVSDGIQITITPVDGAEGYVIEKNINGNYILIKTLGANDKTFIDTDVAPKATYSYRVYATCTGVKSAAYEITGERVAYPEINKTSSTVVAVSLAWDSVDGAVSYILLRKEKGDTEWTDEFEVDGTTYLDADVYSGVEYVYTVKAVMADGGVSGCNEKGTPYKFIETPDLVSVKNVTGGVQFKWSAVEGATSYTVYRKTSGTSWKNLGKVTGTSYTDKTATDGKKYTYTVRAVDGKYQSSYDKGLTITSLAKPATPKLGKVTNTASGANVTWSSVKGAKSYIVYRKTYSAKTKSWSGWSKIASDVTSTSYLDKKVVSGTYYLYTVKAVNAAGNSGHNTTGIKTYFLSLPKVTTANANSGVTVKWTKAAGATGYIIYRKTTDGWTRVATVKGSGTVSYTDKTAKAGVTYRYTVKAYYSSYFSAYNTNGVAVRRLTTPTLKSATSSKSGITVTWNKVTGATGYIVYRKTGSGSWQKLTTFKGATKVSYLDKTAKKGVTYSYTVKAYYGTSTSNHNAKGIACKDRY